MTGARILLAGAAGQLGRDLRRALMPVGSLRACARRAPPASGLLPLDITDSARVRAVISEWRPHYVVNAAAYTAVDQAEGDAATAHAVNADAAGTLAALAHEHDATLLHYSTDYVFSGDARQPWREDDVTEPVNEYGRSKLAGEQQVTQSGCSHLVLRTGWLYATPTTFGRISAKTRTARVKAMEK